MTARIDLEARLQAIGPCFEEAAAEHDRTDHFVHKNFETLRGHRLLSALVPGELGGGGASHREMCAFLRGLARHCSSTALSLSMHQHLVSTAVYNFRNDRPGWQILRKIAADEIVLVSTGARDWLESSGKTEKVDGGYLVTAAKPFASGAPAGDVLVTSAPFDDPADGPQVLHFSVPLSANGVTVGEDWQAMGMRATGSHTVTLDRVFVPEGAIALRRPRGAFHPAWTVILTNAMPMIMSVYLGIAESAATIAAERARRRLDDPATPFLVGEMTTALETARIAVAAMIDIADDWNFAPETEIGNAILIRKTIAANAVLATAQKAMEVAGGAGFYRKLGLEKLVRDLHGVRYHPLPEKSQQLFTGRLALGLSPVETVDGEASSARAA